MNNALTIGAYKNSECKKNSFYAGYTKEIQLSDDIGFGATFGAVTGYKGMDLSPLIVPSMSLNTLERIKIRLSVVPDTASGKLLYRNLHFSLEKNFGSIL